MLEVTGPEPTHSGAWDRERCWHSLPARARRWTCFPVSWFQLG